MDGRPQRGGPRDYQSPARLRGGQRAGGSGAARRGRAQLEAIGRAQNATARQQRRYSQLLWAVAIAVMTLIGYLTWQSYSLAQRELNVFLARATDAMNAGLYDRAIRYALQAYPARGQLPLLTPFSTELEGKLAGAAQSTRLYRLFPGHSVFSDDLKLAATDDGNTTRIWNVETGKQIAELKGTFKQFSADGTRAATEDGDRARIWDLETGGQIAELKGTFKQFNADGTRAATEDGDRARIWDLETGKQIADVPGPFNGFIPGGNWVVAGRTPYVTSEPVIWDVDSGKHILKGDIIALSDVGKKMLTTNGALWNLESGQEIARLDVGYVFGFVEVHPRWKKTDDLQIKPRGPEGLFSSEHLGCGAG